MNTCHVSNQIDNHLHSLDVGDAFNEAVNKRISKLMEGEFSPKIKENLLEGIIFHLTVDQEKIFLTMVNHSDCTLAKKIKELVFDEFDNSQFNIRYYHVKTMLKSLSSDQENSIVEMVNKRICILSNLLNSWVSGYWETLAEQQAIKELSE
jgi:hypothetical protein